MKKLSILLITGITLISCNTTREVQVQRGTYEVVNNRIKFNPIENWKKFDYTAPDTIFRLRNTAVRKNKMLLPY